MEIAHFNDLLAAARSQAEQQRLLLVFASASLPANASAEQKARFEAGESGELAPLMCVAKDPAELPSFAALVDQAATLSADWALVFAAALAGTAGHAPSDSQTDAALQRLVEAVKAGDLAGLIPFDRQGDAVQFA